MGYSRPGYRPGMGYEPGQGRPGSGYSRPGQGGRPGMGYSRPEGRPGTGYTRPEQSRPMAGPSRPGGSRSFAGHADPGRARPAVSARSAMLYDAQAGRVLLAKDAQRVRPVASLTKVMTAYIVLKEGRLDDRIRITEADVRHARTSGATHAALRPGEVLTTRELLYALMLSSASDASEALARTYGPGVPRFVDKMNRYASRLGMRQTRYVNPDGLPETDRSGRGGFSTASDQVRLARLALLDPAFTSIASAPRYTLAAAQGRPARTWRNTNSLLTSYRDAVGVKTGFTSPAGFCLSFAARRDGRLLIGVLLDATKNSSASRFRDAARLLDWAYSADRTPLVATGESAAGATG
ncbi:D-alanyl-D-alanine carboxypeptidase family protein [Rhizohabitans arisaemae]|uniref:D-alanyl-D-alanine carboxypeptidase family protein n=1 Tax=Rhizohabitans arisaemae TaxID=2720610 RepID=UPI0024B1AEBA|nr:serine hydrolase [Rhizohabitans arisaemae]